MPLRDMNRVLNDYSLDWEARMKKAHTIMDQAKVVIKENVKKTSEEVKANPKFKKTVEEIKKKVKRLSFKK